MPDPWKHLPPIAGGEEEVEEEENVEKRQRRYVFLIVGPRPYETSEIERSLDRDKRAFGRELGGLGVVSRVNPDRADQELAKTASLDWPRGISTRIRESPDPLILILDRDRRDFDPSQHPWAIIWLSEYDPTKLYRVFSTLARITKDENQNIFDYLRCSTTQLKAKSFGKRWIGAIEIKPSIFGISLNVNNLLLGDGRG